MFHCRAHPTLPAAFTVEEMPGLTLKGVTDPVTAYVVKSIRPPREVEP